MGPALNGLIKLQSVENRLRAVSAKLTRCRRTVIIQENQIRNLQSSLEAKKEEVLLTKVQSGRLELELKVKAEAMTKLRASLNAAKSNKEYAAILTQLNTTKADNIKIENQVLELLKDIETDEAECQDIQNRIGEQKQTLEHVRKDAELSATKYETEVEEIRAEWDQVAQTVPTGSLDIFKRVAETYDGEALAGIEKQGDKTETYSCGGCFMGITAESVNLLMTRDDIIRCPNCTRILVLGGSQDKGE